MTLDYITKAPHNCS
jgi:hypothetical protein